MLTEERPLLYLQTEDKYALQLGLRVFDAAAGGAPAYNWMMAASLVVILPVLVIFLLFQRFFIEGVTLSVWAAAKPPGGYR